MSVIKNIEKFLDDRIHELYPEKKTAINHFPKAELKYNASMGRLYSLVAFYLYDFLKQNFNYDGTPEYLADRIVENSDIENCILSSDSGFINIELNSYVIDSELERIAKNEIGLSKMEVEPPKCDDDFLTWYCCNKLTAGFKYLWNESNNILISEDKEVNAIAIHAIYLISSENLNRDKVMDYAKLFYEYDRKLVGAKVPFNLYLTSLYIFRKLLEK